MQRYDVVVVGAGPTGLACGIELQQRGVSTVLLEKGCVVNSIYNYPTYMMFFTTPELLEIGNLPMTSLNEKPGRTEALKYYRRVADHYELNIHQYERVMSIQGDDGDFEVRTSKGEYHARKIVLATGYYDLPNMLNVPGEELDKVVHYYKEPHPYYNHDVIVIGAREGYGDPTQIGPRSVGHVARFVLDHAPCPVLLVRPRAHEQFPIDR